MSQANALEVYMLQLINAERAKEGLPPFTFNNILNESSEDHSLWMLQNDIFSHTGVGGSTPGERIVDAGYVLQGTWATGENIGFQSQRGAAGFEDDVRDIHIALMNSPGHRANIMSTSYDEIGIGIEIGTYKGYPSVMITQNFGATDATSNPTPPAPPTSSVIRLEAGQTSVTLPHANAHVTVHGNGLNNRITGAANNETFNGGDGSDTLIGGAGNDTLNGQNHSDRLFGGAGNDALIGGAGADIMYGEAGNDTMNSGDDADRLYGGSGNDLLRAGWAFGTTVDGLWGDSGNDTLLGESGYDMLDGGTGNDLLDGGTQADNLYGQAGNDTLRGGQGHDRLFAGDGNDFARGGTENDGLFGGSGNDTLAGESGNDRMFGEVGEDRLDGGAGNDTLYGGASNDTLIGGTGNDVLLGNFNADTFVFADGHGRDTITDFHATNDLEKIDLSKVSSIVNMSDLVNNHMSQVGVNVVIDTGGGNSITLNSTNIADLDSADFIF